MPTEKELELTRQLIQWLETFEMEIRALSFTLAAMRVTYPEFDALTLLREAREHPKFKDEVRAKYERMHSVVNQVEVLELLKDWPTSDFIN